MKAIFIIRGKVIKGRQRGRLLGFPTANISLHQKVPEGIYASAVAIEGKDYIAATFIGSAKTFRENDYKAESYILEFKDNIYDKWITIKLFQKVRGNERFVSEAMLIKQMNQDVQMVREFFKLP